MSLPLLEQSSRNRSDSTGDSGLPQHEHKRPRLSEGQQNQSSPLTVSVPDSAKVSTAKLPVSSNSEVPTSALESPPQSPVPASQMSDATSPQSKVTINTRPILSRTSTVSGPAESDRDTMDPDAFQPNGASNPRITKIIDSKDPKDAISISSDDQGSPIVQVAAPEDLDQDPDQTQWEPLPSATSPDNPPIGPNHVQQTFPYCDQSAEIQPHVIVQQIAKTFEYGAVNDKEIFERVKAWVTQFAGRADGLGDEFFDNDLEFWLKFPNIVSGLLRRGVATPHGLEISELIDFFVAYTRISLAIIKADVEKLRVSAELAHTKITIHLRCLGYLGPLQWMITSADIPLYENFQDFLDFDPKFVTETIIDKLLESDNVETSDQAPHHHEEFVCPAHRLMCSLTALFQAMSALFPLRTPFIEPGLNLVGHVGHIIRLLSDRVDAEIPPRPNIDALMDVLLIASTQLVDSVNEVLDRAVLKQQPWLNIDTCEKVFKVITPSVGCIAKSFPSFAANLLVTAKIDFKDFFANEVIKLGSIAWKLTTLQKFIKKGRMEVRVTCVQIMATDLVQVYNEHIRSNDRDLEHADVQLMVQFLRKNDIIRYIIGVDSHPQIIERCVNIIGFLCVSHSYRNEDTDAIWQAILESQDPRTVVALLGVFQHNLENLDTETLCYIASKLLITPYDRFDTHMLDFAMRLTNLITAKPTRTILNPDDEIEADDCVLRLCLKMLREANTPDRICSELSSRVRTQIQPTLAQKVRFQRGRLSLGNEVDVMNPMFVELCDAIRLSSNYASGSALALRTMLSEADFEECSRVVQEHSIAPLLIDDITQACNTTLNTDVRDSAWLEFESRFGLLVTVVFRTNFVISDSLLKKLWVDVLALPELNDRLRQMAWSSLANIFEHCRIRNDTLDNIVHNYLPKFPPSLYDSAVLHFVQQSVKYEMRHTPIDLTEPEAIVVLPGIERLWDIMLRAPSNSVELVASQFIIEQYLDGDLILRQRRSSIEVTHLALIDRCVKEVIEAADKLKQSSDSEMEGVASARSTAEDPLAIDLPATRFHRCLLFLRNFLNNMKARPRYTPAANDNLKSTLNTFGKKGQPFEVTLQIIGHRTLANVQSKWTIGYENSGAEVWRFLSDLTGWSQFMIITGGRKLTLKDEQKSLQDLGVKQGSFMINKVQGSPESAPARAIRASSPVDNKVMHHFDELYRLLELEDQYAKEVYDFLGMFSSQREIVDKLKSKSIPPAELLPVEKPFKLMYYSRTLRSCIEDESFSIEPDTAFLAYGIRTILSVLPNLRNLEAATDICISIAHGLLEALILGFRARVPAEVSNTYILDGVAFTDNIFRLWRQALEASEPLLIAPSAAVLIRTPFEALVEGLLHDDRHWITMSHDSLVDCLQKSLLVHPSEDVRRAILEVVQGLTGVVTSKSAAKGNQSRTPRTRFSTITIDNCLRHLWKILLALLAEDLINAATCEEYFDAVVSVFRQHRGNLNQEDLGRYAAEWKHLLLSHKHNHSVGMAPQDFFLSSLGRLLIQAVKALQSFKPLADSETFIHDLFVSYLFPPLTDTFPDDTSTGHQPVSQQDPILDMNTRWVLYELILTLCSNDSCTDVICNELNGDLIPQPFYFQPAAGNDRQILRSESGYSGLRNLSNTCYLNSLISQLFMNVEFRELIMNVNIIDHSKQRLVAELGKVFAFMQASYEEAISPEAAIDAITLWDGDQIDVTVQMDVDEFFNLLFDRLESQIVDPKVCGAFKSIYGGQLVQQIKSKECEHVSERFEPFAAVQVEIKGKASLEQSLRAYVEGEVLQGENKYSCTGCGKHVDAVKRACLKTVPDHLIFNLKRFDYDIMTGMRCKVNDEFGFPDEIDMTPYTLEALTNPDQPREADIFELVGIIIHSGTAESGHYYSYIRQRPSTESKEKSWVQFNDHDVTQFDPGSIRECCFGGTDFGAIQCPKFYNGYMLFYQRKTSIQAFERKYLDDNHSSPVRLPLESGLESHIAQHNELYLRSYVAQDPVHAKFIRQLLQQKQTIPELTCLRKHSSVTSKLLLVALGYVNNVSARWKDLPEVEETMLLLRTYATSCAECAKQIIRWLIKDENLVNNVVRSCYVAVRKSFVALIIACWSSWQQTFHQIQQSPGVHRSASATAPHDYLSALARFLSILAGGWEHIQRFGRCWEQYFGVVTYLLHAGEFEARAVIEANFLELTLELVHVHMLTLPAQKRLKLKYSVYLLQRERNRLFLHGLLIQFLADLLQHVDLVMPITDCEDRIVFDGRVSLSTAEAMLLGMTHPPQFNWLKKVVFGRFNEIAACSIIINLCRTRQFDALICTVLKDGLGDRNLMNALACLKPTLTFGSCCSATELVIETLSEGLMLIETTNGQYGKDFLSFVQEVLQISNTEASIPPGTMTLLVKKHVHDWAPALLMAPNDVHADVRNDTLNFLNELLFRGLDEMRSTEPRQFRQHVSICRGLAKACAAYVETVFLCARPPVIQAGQANQAVQVVDLCLRFYSNSASEEDQAAQITNVMEEFRARSEGVVETITEADWNATSDLEAMSEVDNMSDTSN